jgi:hypothetical protein
MALLRVWAMKAKRPGIWQARAVLAKVRAERHPGRTRGGSNSVQQVIPTGPQQTTCARQPERAKLERVQSEITERVLWMVDFRPSAQTLRTGIAQMINT